MTRNRGEVEGEVDGGEVEARARARWRRGGGEVEAEKTLSGETALAHTTYTSHQQHHYTTLHHTPGGP